jgi:hypothetical protein
MISLEITPGIWWHQVNTEKLPQDGQRLIKKLEDMFLAYTEHWIDSDFDKMKEKLHDQWRDACLNIIVRGALPLHWRWDLTPTEVTDKHFIRNNDHVLFAMIEGVNGKTRDSGGNDKIKKRTSRIGAVLDWVRRYLFWGA